MRRVALREVRAHLVRFALSVLAVLLGVAFVAGTFSLRAMLSSTFDEIIATSVQGDAYLRGSEPSVSGNVVGDAREPRTRIPIEVRESAAAVDGVAGAFPDVRGPLVLVGADGTAVVSGQAPSFGIGLDVDDPSAEVVEGRRPAGAGEIALESTTAASSGLVVGDTTTAVVGSEAVAVEVVGRIDTGAPSAGATLVFLDLATAEAAYAPDGLVESIAVYAREGLTEDELVTRVAAAVADLDGVEVVTGTLARTEAIDAVNQLLGFIGAFLLVFAGISLFVGAFIIANTFAMSVRQRQREFALLRAVGASPGQVFASVLVQAGVIGLVGSALGVGAGAGLVAGLRVVLARMGMNLSGAIPLEASTVALSIAVGIVVSVVAAAVPARRAALVPPVEAMRDDVLVKDRSLLLRAVAGAVLLAASLAAVVAATSGRVTSAGTWLGVGAAGTLVAVLALAPVVARVVLGVLAWPAEVSLRPLGRLARGNVTRNPRRTANTAGALMIGMALVGATTVLASTAQASTRSVVEAESTADLVVQSASRTVPGGAVAALRSLATVGHADTVSVGTAELTTDGGEPALTTLAAVSDGAFGRALDVVVTAGTLEEFGAGDAAVQRRIADAEGWAVGDRFQLRTDSATAEVTVTAVVDSQILATPLVLPEETFTQLLAAPQREVAAVFLTAADGVGLETLRADVVEAAAPFVVLSVQTNDELATALAEQVSQVLVILYALLALSVVIAVLGIVNTLALSVIERTREIGLLRAVGLGRMQLAGTIAVESVLTALFGTVVGVAVGVALASTMPSVFADVGLSTLAVPWPQIALMLALAVVVGVLAALWPAARAARLPVLEAIAQE